MSPSLEGSSPHRVVVIGASGHGSVVADVILRAGTHELVGFLDDRAKPGTRILGRPVLGSTAELLPLMEQFAFGSGIVAIGDNWVRSLVVERISAVAPDFRFITAVHPSAQLGSGVTLGEGTVIMAGAIVNPGTTVGEFCILNTGSCIDHDCRLGRFGSVAPGAVAGGNVSIGAFSAISLGARIIHGRNIGDHTVVGAGATVLHDLPGHAVAYGTPARVIRSRSEGDRYL